VDPLPELEWAVLGARRLDREGAVHALDAAAPLATLELQPGPVIVGDTVVVTARSVQGELAAWLLAFDLADGELRWARQLAQGADLAAEGSRFRFGRPRRPAAQPPIAVGALVFAGTHLGSGHLVDPLDGRIVWSVAARRRAPSVAGWAGARPAVRALPDGGHEVLWAPADSDRLYALRVDGGALPRGAAGGSARATDALFAAVQAIGEARAVLGAAPDGIVLQGRAGRERAVFRRSRDGAQRTDAVYLGREEEFRSVGSAAGARAIACSDRGLYLFDLERDLALLDYAWLGPTGPDQPRATARDTGLGGELLVDGERVWVVGNGAAWAFRVAP
jgi:outer membrane protein assembly factor BamB